MEFPRLLHSGAFCRSHFFTFGSGDRTIWNVTQSACRAFVMISTSPWLRAGALNSTDLAPIVGWPEQEGSVRMVVVVVEAVEQVSSCIRKSYIPGAQLWQQVSGLVSSGTQG